MTAHAIVSTIFHAAVWRGMHFAGLWTALAIAAGAVAVGLYLNRHRL